MCGAPSLVKHPVVLDRTQLTAQRLQVVQALRCAVGRFGAPVRHRGYGKTTCPLARQLKIGVQTAKVLSRVRSSIAVRVRSIEIPGT